MPASPPDSAHIRVPPVPPAGETTAASLDEKLAYPLTTYADEGASLRYARARAVAWWYVPEVHCTSPRRVTPTAALWPVLG